MPSRLSRPPNVGPASLRPKEKTVVERPVHSLGGTESKGGYFTPVWYNVKKSYEIPT